MLKFHVTVFVFFIDLR